MSLTAAVSDESRPNPLPGWLFWLVNLVIAPITAVLVAYAISGGGAHWSSAMTITVVAYAGLYAVIARVAGIEPTRAAGGFLLALLLSVPWAYVLVIGALIISCETGGTCLS